VFRSGAGLCGNFQTQSAIGCGKLLSAPAIAGLAAPSSATSSEGTACVAASSYQFRKCQGIRAADDIAAARLLYGNRDVLSRVEKVACVRRKSSARIIRAAVS
jgi:hypothetical protein